MYNERSMKDFTQNIAHLYGLSEEHGCGLYQMMINSFDGSSELYFSTPSWRITMNKIYNWSTDKPTTRILNELEDVGFISRRDRFSYSLNRHLFGTDYWGLISGINMVVNYNDDGREIIITRNYSKWDEDNGEEILYKEEQSTIHEQ